MFTEEQRRELDGPLLSSHVKERKQGGRQVSYIEGWHAIAEANRIFGFDAWDRETVTLIETNRDLVDIQDQYGKTYQQWRVGYLAKVRVRVDGTVREGTGFGSGMAKPEALGEAVESAAKEAETDAMKRALMTFGNPFGLALYDKTRENVEHVRPDASPSAREAAPAPSGIKRLTSARAKEIGLDAKIRGLVEGCASLPALDMLESRFDTITAEAPLSWLDSIRNMIELQREELSAGAKHAEMDAEFKAVMA